MNKAFEKIIEKLENELKLADEEKLRCARENPLQFDSAKGYSNGVANSIEIVKQFCISDDVCEWKDGAIGIFNIKTSCGNSIDVNYGYEFCPYCGKKIKVVGD